MLSTFTRHESDVMASRGPFVLLWNRHSLLYCTTGRFSPPPLAFLYIFFMKIPTKRPAVPAKESRKMEKLSIKPQCLSKLELDRARLSLYIFHMSYAPRDSFTWLYFFLLLLKFLLSFYLPPASCTFLMLLYPLLFFLASYSVFSDFNSWLNYSSRILEHPKISRRDSSQGHIPLWQWQ